MSPADRYLALVSHVRTLALQAGRDPSEISIVCVTKTWEWETIKPVYDAGCQDFGENKVQEALPKLAMASKTIRWHFIGTLQKNKVSKIINRFALIHSVDQLSLAEKIAACSSAQQVRTSILIQVNTSGEQTKHGWDQETWLANFAALLNLKGIDVQGLMTIAPLTADQGKVRACFKELRLFRDQLERKFGIPGKLKHLSMGMTQDYPIAIQEGATLLRVGSFIFGERD